MEKSPVPQAENKGVSFHGAEAGGCLVRERKLLGSHSVVPPFGLRGSDQVRVGSRPVESAACLLIGDLIFRYRRAAVLLDDLGSSFQRETVVAVRSGFPFRVTYSYIYFLRSRYNARCHHQSGLRDAVDLSANVLPFLVIHLLIYVYMTNRMPAASPHHP